MGWSEITTSEIMCAKYSEKIKLTFWETLSSKIFSVHVFIR